MPILSFSTYLNGPLEQRVCIPYYQTLCSTDLKDISLLYFSCEDNCFSKELIKNTISESLNSIMNDRGTYNCHVSLTFLAYEIVINDF